MSRHRTEIYRHDGNLLTRQFMGYELFTWVVREMKTKLKIGKQDVYTLWNTNFLSSLSDKNKQKFSPDIFWTWKWIKTLKYICFFPQYVFNGKSLNEFFIDLCIVLLQLFTLGCNEGHTLPKLPYIWTHTFLKLCSLSNQAFWTILWTWAFMISLWKW